MNRTVIKNILVKEWGEKWLGMGKKETTPATETEYKKESSSPFEKYDDTKDLPSKDTFIDHYKDKPGYSDIIHKNVRKGNILVVHPDDKSTDFLDPSYEGLNATVLTSKKDMFNLRENMKTHNKIVMMGHGSPYGLFLPSVYGVEMDKNGKLKKYQTYSINSSFVDILKTKEIVAVWCNADGFVVPHDLHGFYTGMAISELTEANYCGVHGCNHAQLEESDRLFALGLQAALRTEGPAMVEAFKEVYNNPKNPIMVYNRQRLYYR